MNVKPRIVAEIGTAHRGDIKKASDLIHAAKEAGADTAKFQLVKAEEILHPNSGIVNLPSGKVPLYERYRELEREDDFFAELIAICDKVDIRFLCTPFGMDSARILKQLGVAEIKIASPELNHVPLLREVASYRKPLILSTGVATLTDINDALQTVGTQVPVTLLHCITAYPAPEEEYNLRVIPAMADILGVPVGISDHSLDPILVPGLATLMGASMIEKHITLNRSDKGLDDAIALEPQDFRKMVRSVRQISDRMVEAARKDPLEVRRVELDLESQLRDEYGSARVTKVLGTGIKALAPSEQRNYGYTNRTIHAVMDLPEGTMLSRDNTAILRSERNLRPGLHPRHWETVLGARLQRRVPAGEGIRWEDLLVTGESR